MLTRGKIAAALIGQAICFVIIGLVLWHLSGREVSDFVVFKFESALIGVFIGLAMIGLLRLLWTVSPDFWERLVYLQADTYRDICKVLNWPMILVISAGAGIGEEALFRGGLQTFLGDITPPAVAVLIAAFAFAMLHMAKFYVFVLIWLIGGIFGLLYWWTGDLLAMILGHAVYDVWALYFLKQEMHRLGLLDEDPEGEGPDGREALVNRALPR